MPVKDSVEHFWFALNEVGLLSVDTVTIVQRDQTTALSNQIIFLINPIWYKVRTPTLLGNVKITADPSFEDETHSPTVYLLSRLLT